MPNIVFELFAAGALQAVLVPSLVARFDRGEDRGAERLAGSVLGFTALGLAVFAVLGAVAAPWIMEVLVSGVDDPEIRADQVRLGTIFLLVFLPQIIVYDVGIVATAVLHARGRFALPAIAPAVNNVVVSGAYLTFWYLRDGKEPSLDLSVVEIAVLAGGTSFAVLAFCTIPVVGAWRTGFRFRPNLDRSDPALRALAGQGTWAGLYLAMTQVLLGAVLILANRAEGGVVAYQVGFTFFLLPHALFALPVLTTLFPTASRQVHSGDWSALSATIRRGTTAIALFVLPAAAALATLAEPLSGVALFGNVDRAGAALIADVVTGFAPGLIGYALFYFLTRMLYATGDMRTPTLVHAAVVAVGVTTMFVSSIVVDADALIPALAWSHSVTYLLGAVALLVVVRSRLAARSVPVRLGGILGRQVLAGGSAAVTMAAIAVGLDLGGRIGDLATLVLAGGGGLVVHLAVQAVLGGPKPWTMLGLLRQNEAREEVER
ncbi:MAG: murein biosynthesis integral membrane protein MurJ [Acidimicrobiales bacterium]